MEVKVCALKAGIKDVLLTDVPGVEVTLDGISMIEFMNRVKKVYGKNFFLEMTPFSEVAKYYESVLEYHRELNSLYKGEYRPLINIIDKGIKVDLEDIRFSDNKESSVESLRLYLISEDYDILRLCLVSCDESDISDAFEVSGFMYLAMTLLKNTRKKAYSIHIESLFNHLYFKNFDNETDANKVYDSLRLKGSIDMDTLQNMCFLSFDFEN
jgi:hypothetical protein